MKKLVMIVAGMLFVSVVAVQAQDTTSFKRSDSTSVSEQQPAQQESIKLKDMTVVKSTEVPATLRETLQGAQYKGWDASTSKIYRNQTSDLFVVQIQDGTMTKTYRFDKDGKPIND
ncbi:MAG TPA: hypothetical protein VK508_22080 [Cyclobacteriaceae bacterium]|nr:hypothetical protein [Cyclobacteriaceae bacterium]